MVNLTRYNVSIVLFVCLGAYSYGFSYAVFGTSIGEPGFYLYFNLNRKFILCLLCIFRANVTAQPRAMRRHLSSELSVPSSALEQHSEL